MTYAMESRQERLTSQDIRFSVAPMMDWTDRHCRYLHRLMSRRARLYTEMLTTGAVIHGDRERLLGFDPFERPLVLQLGGSDPTDLARAAAIAASFDYDEINLNVGCPSDRVQNGAFGACLMLQPALVADCVRAMKDGVDLPVTVKCRIGVDDQDPETALFALAGQAIDAGADALIVHARKAWLKGLSPRENRDVPPLDYALVHRLKRAFPQTPVAINGGIATIEASKAQLEVVDGVMVGRAAYQNRPVETYRSWAHSPSMLPRWWKKDPPCRQTSRRPRLALPEGSRRKGGHPRNRLVWRGGEEIRRHRALRHR